MRRREWRGQLPHLHSPPSHSLPTYTHLPPPHQLPRLHSSPPPQHSPQVSNELLEDVGEGEITIVVQADVHNTLNICGRVMVCTGGGDGVKHVVYSTTLHNSVYLLMDTLNNSE